MGTVIAAYVVAWVGVALYLGWLAAQQRQMRLRLEALESSRQQSKNPERPSSKVA